MKFNDIDLNKIKVFHSVVKNGTYQLASEELGLTRSAISQSITTLESQIGVSLFQRKGRKLFPTENAQNLANEFSSYQCQLHQALERVRNETNTVEGLVRIGAYFEFAKTWLTPRVNHFCERYPQAQFKFIFDSPSKLQELLEAGKIDMSFSIFSHKGTKEIRSNKILEQELVLIAPTKFAGKAQSLEGLIELPIIEYYSNHQVLPRWTKIHFNKRCKSFAPKVFAASAEMLLEFVAQGSGVGIVPLYILESRKNHNIKVIRPTKNKLNDFIWLNQFSGQFENSAHQKFYKDILSSF